MSIRSLRPNRGSSFVGPGNPGLTGSFYPRATAPPGGLNYGMQFGAFGVHPGNAPPGFVDSTNSVYRQGLPGTQPVNGMSMTARSLLMLAGMDPRNFPSARTGGTFGGPVNVHAGEMAVPNGDGTVSIITEAERRRQMMRAKNKQRFLEAQAKLQQETGGAELAPSAGRQLAAIESGTVPLSQIHAPGTHPSVRNRFIGPEGEQNVAAVRDAHRNRLRDRLTAEGAARANTPREDLGGRTPSQWIADQAGTGVRTTEAERLARLSPEQRAARDARQEHKKSVQERLTERAMARQQKMRDAAAEAKEARELNVTPAALRSYKQQQAIEQEQRGLENTEQQAKIAKLLAEASAAQQRGDLDGAEAARIFQEIQIVAESIAAGTAPTGEGDVEPTAEVESLRAGVNSWNKGYEPAAETATDTAKATGKSSTPAAPGAVADAEKAPESGAFTPQQQKVVNRIKDGDEIKRIAKGVPINIQRGNDALRLLRDAIELSDARQHGKFAIAAAAELKLVLPKVDRGLEMNATPIVQNESGEFLQALHNLVDAIAAGRKSDIPDLMDEAGRLNADRARRVTRRQRALRGYRPAEHRSTSMPSFR